MRNTIRTALREEAEAIHDIIKPFADEGILLYRSIQDIRESIESFFVMYEGDTMAGVITHHNYGSHLKEVRSLAVRREYSKKGFGSALVQHLLKSLFSSNPRTRVFVLTYSPIFFDKLGFREVPKESLPEKIWKDCGTCKKRDCCDETALVYAGPAADKK